LISQILQSLSLYYDPGEKVTGLISLSKITVGKAKSLKRTGSNSSPIKMPLDTSTTYPLTKLRLDGRRWNELRLLQAQISTNPASSGSSYLAMGNTTIMCSVHGPAEGRRGDATGGAAGSSGAVVEVDVNVAGFAGVDRKRRAGGSDKYAT
jgi:hypothetical protein